MIEKLFEFKKRFRHILVQNFLALGPGVFKGWVKLCPEPSSVLTLNQLYELYTRPRAHNRDVGKQKGIMNLIIDR